MRLRRASAIIVCLLPVATVPAAAQDPAPDPDTLVARAIARRRGSQKALLWVSETNRTERDVSRRGFRSRTEYFTYAS